MYPVRILSLSFLLLGLIPVLRATDGSMGVRQPVSDNSLRFTENKGQWDSKILYKMPLHGGAIFFESNHVTFNFIHPEDWEYITGHDHQRNANPQLEKIIRSHSYKIEFAGSQLPTIGGENARSDYSNYFIGDDQSRWASGVASYYKLNYKELYPGIDFQYYQKGQDLKYDVKIHPG